MHVHCNPGADSAQCHICSSSSSLLGESLVLRRYPAKYLRCSSCGFIQTEQPYWLDEAYSSAIASQDVGILFRNQTNCEVTSAVLNLLFPDVKSAIDYGGGDGVLVRLMRDRGFNFFWWDLHAANMFARGFEAPMDAKFDFLSAFEVLEHLVDPLVEIAKLMELSDNVLASTCLVPEPVPSIADWWYYMPTSGQHVSFYTPASLQSIAKHFNRYLLSVGPYHLFTREPANYYWFRFATSPRMARWINKAYPRAGLIASDLEKMAQ